MPRYSELKSLSQFEYVPELQRYELDDIVIDLHLNKVNRFHAKVVSRGQIVHIGEFNYEGDLFKAIRGHYR